MRKITVRIIHYLALSLCLLAINACGQKGDLYLPEQGSLVEKVPTRHT